MNYEFCILNEEKDFIEYERGLFKTFSESYPEDLLNDIFDRIGSDRFKSKVPYEDQLVYCMKNMNEIVAAISFNINKNNLTFKKKGFTISKNEEMINFCEGLTLFASEKFKGEDFLNIFIELGKNVVIDLKKKNIEMIYAVTPKNLKTMYSLFGFKMKQSIDFHGIKSYFMEYDIKNDEEAIDL